MISINLHDFRYELVKVEIQKRTVKFVGIILGSLVLAGLAWISEQMKVPRPAGEAGGRRMKDQGRASSTRRLGEQEREAS